MVYITIEYDFARCSNAEQVKIIAAYKSVLPHKDISCLFLVHWEVDRSKLCIDKQSFAIAKLENWLKKQKQSMKIFT